MMPTKLRGQSGSLLRHVQSQTDTMNRNNCVMGLRLCNNVAALQRMQRIWRIVATFTDQVGAMAKLT